MVEFNLLDTGTFARGHPHDVYDEMRRSSPVYRHAGTDARPAFWALTREREADIRAVSSDGENFSSTKSFTVRTDSRNSLDPEIAHVLSRFMLSMDDPEHAEFRNVAQQAFLPAALRKLEPRIRASVDRLLESLRDRDQVEFVQDVGAMVPIQAICAIMGIPAEDEARVFEFTTAIFAADDPDFSPSPEIASARYLEIFDYAMFMLEQRRQDPQDDLLTLIAHSEVNGRPLTEAEQKSYFSNMIGAGNETTRSSLAGAVQALFHYPAERARLIADPDLIRRGVHELLRWFSPVIQMARTAKHDVELGGETIRAGEWVSLLYGAANHDPELFEDPHRLDIGRRNANRNVTFGVGVHFCMGVRLALMEMRILLEAFLQRYPQYEITDEPKVIRSNLVLATRTLPMRLNPA